MPRPERVQTCRMVFLSMKEGEPVNENDLKTADRDYPTASGEDIVCLTMQWETINWRKVYGHVNRMKTRIAKASLNSQTENVRRLQRLLVNSLDARLAAVKAVTTNKGRHTAGVDGVLWNTSAQKIEGGAHLGPERVQSQAAETSLHREER